MDREPDGDEKEANWDWGGVGVGALAELFSVRDERSAGPGISAVWLADTSI
jgi:hypothetical protein